MFRIRVALIAVICLPLMIGEKVRGAIYIEGFRESNPLRQEDFLLLKTIKRLLELSLEIDDLNRGAAPHSRNRKRHWPKIALTKKGRAIAALLLLFQAAL